METSYTSEIRSASRELSPIEKIKYKDLTATVSLDEELKAAENNKLTFKPELIYTVHVHNEKAKGDKDYDTMVVVDSETGVRYRTSSNSFMTAVHDFLDELADGGINPSDLTFVAYTRPSKNFTGKSFLTCAIQ